MSAKGVISQEELKRLLDYSPETGVFTWKVKRKGSGIGREAGSVTNYGYRRICVAGERHHAHRLAFLWMAGSFPDEDVDHINHDRLDNRWCNLRACSRSDNMKNSSLWSSNRSGAPGVHWDRANKKWRASIAVGGRCENLGRFENVDDAVAARRAAERRHGFHPNHGDPQ